MNTDPIQLNWSPKSGFSLVEVSLAILISAVGLLTVMAVFPVGLEINRKSTDQLQYALFSQQVFDGLQAYSEFSPWGSLSSETLEAVAYDEWLNFNTLEVRTGSDDLTYVNYDDVAANQFEQYAFRYELDVVDAGDFKTVQLRVLPRYGSENALEFYTEIFHKGVE